MHPRHFCAAFLLSSASCSTLNKIFESQDLVYSEISTLLDVKDNYSLKATSKTAADAADRVNTLPIAFQESFKLPKRYVFKPTPDFECLRGYVFNDSLEDTIMKMEILFLNSKYNLNNSPLKSVVSEAIMDIMLGLSKEDLAKILTRLSVRDLYNIFEEVQGRFFTHPKMDDLAKKIHAAVPTLIEFEHQYIVFRATRGERLAPHSANGAEKILRVFHKNSRETQITKMAKIFKSTSDEAIVHALPINVWKTNFIWHISQYTDLGERNWSEVSVEKLHEYLRVMKLIEQGPGAQDYINDYPDEVRSFFEMKCILRAFVGEEVSSEEITSMPSREVKLMAVSGLIYSGRFEQAVENLLREERFPFRIIFGNIEFLKYAAPRFAESAPELIERYKSLSFYFMKALGGSSFSLETAFSFGDRIFYEMADEKDLQTIYDSPIVRGDWKPYIFLALSNFRQKTEEGRQWIISEAENNPSLAQSEQYRFAAELANFGHASEFLYYDLDSGKYLLISDAVIKAFLNQEQMEKLAALVPILRKYRFVNTSVLNQVFLNIFSAKALALARAYRLFTDEQIGGLLFASQGAFLRFEVVVDEMINKLGLQAVMNRYGISNDTDIVTQITAAVSRLQNANIAADTINALLPEMTSKKQLKLSLILSLIAEFAGPMPEA